MHATMHEDPEAMLSVWDKGKIPNVLSSESLQICVMRPICLLAEGTAEGNSKLFERGTIHLYPFSKDLGVGFYQMVKDQNTGSF